MNERSAQIITLVERELIPALEMVLANAIDEHYSEAQWKRIAEVATAALTARLKVSLELEKIANAGDLRDVRGKVNVPGLAAALHQLLLEVQSGPKAGSPLASQVKYFVQHSQQVLSQL